MDKEQLKLFEQKMDEVMSLAGTAKTDAYFNETDEARYAMQKIETLIDEAYGHLPKPIF